MSADRVLVVGTTSDYIDLISRRFPCRALFITAHGERARAAEPAPPEPYEVLCELTRADAVLAALKVHLERWHIRATGVACFDCESMQLAAQIGSELALPYPSAAAVAACRSKLVSKRLWRRAGLPCPEAELVRTVADAAGFLHRIGRHGILKPLTGSGSELLFVCASDGDCAEALGTMTRRLAEHADERMYAASACDGGVVDPRRVFVIEEFVRGTEYSCDFIVDGRQVEVIRIARKVPARGQTVGTTLAYVVPSELPPPLEMERFRRQLHAAARSLGVERAVCMLDFMVEGGEAKMIEIAPRPGGDCLPWLIRRCSGLDMLGLALDLAEGRAVRVPGASEWRRLVGLRLFAGRAGVVRRIGTDALDGDRRVVEVYLKRKAGHRVVLPPDDYDSRLLGHVIFEPTSLDAVEAECDELRAKLELEMEPA